MGYALITGASSGIGFELAFLLAKDGYDLLLVARNKAKLNISADKINDHFKVQIKVFDLDLGKQGAAEELIKYINDWNIHIDILINNAGFYIKGSFVVTPVKNDTELIYLQCTNLTILTKTIAQKMLVQHFGNILNIASTGAFVPGPYNAVYCAVKSYILSFSLALAEELKYSKIKVTTICPGGTNTSFKDFKKSSLLFPVMSAPKVAAISYRALKKGKTMIVPGFMNKLQVAIAGLIPKSRIASITKKFV